MISEKDWKVLKSQEQYKMYVLLFEKLQQLDTNQLHLWIAVCALSILTVISIVIKWI